MNTLNLVCLVYNGYACARAAQFICEQCLVYNSRPYVAGEMRSHPYGTATLCECHAISKHCNIHCSRNPLLFLFSKCGRYISNDRLHYILYCMLRHPRWTQTTSKVWRTLRKNINALAMLMHDVLHHLFLEKEYTMEPGIGGCALLSLM